jgi:hypothetical protein
MKIRADVGGENVLALTARCTNLVHVGIRIDLLNLDQQRRLSLLLESHLEGKRLVTEAYALVGSNFSVLFRFVEEQAHSHEFGSECYFRDFVK